MKGPRGVILTLNAPEPPRYRLALIREKKGPPAMNEEEKNAAAVADLMRYRALRIGCPIYGDFYGLLHRLQAEKNLAEVVNTPARQCGYYDYKTGRFSLSPI